MQIKVIRFENDGNGYDIGFEVTTLTGRVFYSYTNIRASDLKDCCTDELIVRKAFAELRFGIEARAQELDKKPPIVGSYININEIEEDLE